MAAAAASRLQSALASYRKVSSGGDVTEAVASLERAIVAAQTRGIGSCTLGQQPQAATVAAAIAVNAGCGVTAMARRFGIGNNIAGVRRVADRLATPEGRAAAAVAVSAESQGTLPAVPSGASLKEEGTVPPMPPGAFVKGEGVVPPMPPDAFVKFEVVVKEEVGSDSRPKWQRTK